MTAEVLDTIRVMAWIQRRYGDQACHRYIVSFTTSAADIAAVYELARHALAGRGVGVAGAGRHPAVRKRR